ncbi:caprin homolog [Malaya genurostris]|uniref:caprin homolog n=1 Tax=Malaya genurostris TaxID=325434 RepID=UPI0026F4076B|nr:caprin homolog [Malaya genurostris]
MPSLKVLEGDKNCTSDTFNNSIENTGVEGCNSATEVQSSQVMASIGISNNGNREHPVNPLQQIILIIEHKIRNLEKRKNKLETYKAVEKSGKRLTGDQKNAVSKYEECLTSLELTRELCKQFQSIATAANKDAKKEARRNAFLKAQQENAKVREVLMIQDVLKRLLDDSVQCDFRNGQNGACKISSEDLLLLEKLHEEIQPRRPTNTLESTFVSSVKHAADHLTAVIDGRNKPFGNSSYVHIKTIITNVQECGYFEKDIIVIEKEEKEDDEQPSTEHATEDVMDTPKEVIVEGGTNVSLVKEIPTLQSLDSENVSTMTSTSKDTKNSMDFGESPSAAAVPPPSFPVNINIRANPYKSPSNLPIVDTPSIASLVQNCANTGIISGKMEHVPTNTNFVQTGPMAISVIQHSAAESKHIPENQPGPTTVQAVENAYFKQHYIQQQMRPIHEVIGPGIFFFLQESEIDKPDAVSSPAPFESGHPMVSNINQQSHPQNQIICDIANPTSHSAAGTEHATVSSINQKTTLISPQPAAFNNQPFPNIVASTMNYIQPSHKLTNEKLKSIDNIQIRQPSTSKYNDTCSTPNVSCSSNVTTIETSIQKNVPAIVQHENHTIHQQHLPQINPTKFSTGQQDNIMNPSRESNEQQFPTLIQSLHESSHHIPANKRANSLVEPVREKLRASIPADNISIIPLTNESQSYQTADQQENLVKKQKQSTLVKLDDEWAGKSTHKSKPVEGNFNEKSVYNLSIQSQPKQTSSTNSKTVNHTKQHNECSASNYEINNVSDESNLTVHPQQTLQTKKIQPSHQNEQRNTRGNSNHHYSQNSGGNVRFPNDNCASNSTSTFYKNNERFYQQNQTNNFVSAKADTSYPQRSTMFKNRKDNANDPSSLITGYRSASGNNHSGVTNNNANSVDIRSSGRPINSTRNTGPPSSRSQPRNHSSNSNYAGSRGSSNTGSQHTINA